MVWFKACGKCHGDLIGEKGSDRLFCLQCGHEPTNAERVLLGLPPDIPVVNKIYADMLDPDTLRMLMEE